MNEFISLKERHVHPMYTQDLAQQVLDCTKETVTKMESTSVCYTIQQEFQKCLETGQRRHYICAKQFKEPLEMCTAKYIGKLD